MISGRQVDRFFIAFEQQLGFTLQNDNPFSLILIVPKAYRT